MDWKRLNLAEIERALAELSAEADARGSWHELREEPLTSDAIRRMMEGYRYIDALLAERVELFAYGNSERILELNHRVLCGVSPERRVQFADHIAETARHFYEPPGVGALVDCHNRARTGAPEHLAAMLFAQTLSTPQLFIEGNSRSATLIASYCLASRGRPPLVVTTPLLPNYNALVERCAGLDRDGITGMLGFGLCRRKVEHFLRESLESRFLLATAAPSLERSPAK